MLSPPPCRRWTAATILPAPPWRPWATARPMPVKRPRKNEPRKPCSPMAAVDVLVLAEPQVAGHGGVGQRDQQQHRSANNTTSTRVLRAAISCCSKKFISAEEAAAAARGQRTRALPGSAPCRRIPAGRRHRGGRTFAGEEHRREALAIGVVAHHRVVASPGGQRRCGSRWWSAPPTAAAYSRWPFRSG